MSQLVKSISLSFDSRLQTQDFSWCSPVRAGIKWRRGYRGLTPDSVRVGCGAIRVRGRVRVSVIGVAIRVCVAIIRVSIAIGIIAVIGVSIISVVRVIRVLVCILILRLVLILILILVSRRLGLIRITVVGRFLLFLRRFLSA